MSIVNMKISNTGYKADADAPEGYVSQVFTSEIQVDMPTVMKLEAGDPLPDEYKPKLPKGWEDSPLKVTKKDTYAFKPVNTLGNIRVVE